MGFHNFQSTKQNPEAAPLEVFLGKVFWKYSANLHSWTLMPKCDFTVAKQLYWSHTWTLVFSSKIWCISLEHLSLRTPLEGYFWRSLGWKKFSQWNHCLHLSGTSGILKKNWQNINVECFVCFDQVKRFVSSTKTILFLLKCMGLQTI